MPLVIIGVLLLIAKLADLGPTAGWPWWVVLSPFALAAAWWSFADSSGLTRRRAMDKMEERKRQRREKAVEALGMDNRRQRQLDKVRDDARRRAAGPNAAPRPAEGERRDRGG
jgi:small Trp-rich protein